MSWLREFGGSYSLVVGLVRRVRRMFPSPGFWAMCFVVLCFECLFLSFLALGFGLLLLWFDYLCFCLSLSISN